MQRGLYGAHAGILVFSLYCSPKALVEVSIFNPEWDFTAWSDYGNLKYIELLYRREGDVEWSHALNSAYNRIHFDTVVPAVCVNNADAAANDACRARLTMDSRLQSGIPWG